MLAVQAMSQGQRAYDPVPDSPSVRDGRGEVAPSGIGLAAMEADHGGNAEVVTDRGGFLQVLMDDLHLGQRVVPSPGLEQQLAEGAVRLCQPDRRADLTGEVPCLSGGGNGLLVPVQNA